MFKNTDFFHVYAHNLHPQTLLIFQMSLKFESDDVACLEIELDLQNKILQNAQPIIKSFQIVSNVLVFLISLSSL